MSLTARGLSFGYGDRDQPLFSDVDLRVGTGECALVMAPSGTGKSTLLSILGGLRSPWTGEVRIDDDAADQRGLDRRRGTAWVFQSMHLMPRRTVIDNVAVAVLSRGAHRVQAHQQAHQQLARFGVDQLADRRQRDLSGGESQRVALARAAACDPCVVLADEPTANLDRFHADAVGRVLGAGFPRAAVVVVTHDSALIEIADAVYLLDDGRLVPTARPSESTK